MRELKFRAWDDVEKRMYYGNTEQFDDMLGFRFQHFETDKPVYMQYTGLKDKNGKEIYEGDIIHDHKYDAGLGKVYWSQEYGGWSVHFFTQYTEQLHEWLVDYNESAEIIGNIYENPELLKGEENA